MPRNEHERGHEQQELREAERHEHQTGGSAGMELANNPTFHPNHPTKILISPGTGAGWVSWAPHGATDAFLTWMLTYEPLIRGLERREHKDKLEEKLQEFHKEAHKRFNVERIVVARVGDLVVQDVNAPFEVRENDGSERVVDVSHRRVVIM